MKIFIIAWFIWIAIPAIINAQCSLKSKLSIPRGGDIMLRKQVNHQSPGTKGENVIWDFSKLIVENNNRVIHNRINDSVLTIFEHETTYKFQHNKDSLLYLGYENSKAKITNILPELVLKYPFQYKDSISSYFYGNGKYSQYLYLISRGISSTSADAYGTILLPDQDTLQNVIRIHNVKYIIQKIADSKEVTPLYIPTNDISFITTIDSIYWKLDTYRWYALGYRYPIFETIETTIYQNGTEKKHYNKTFYCPPSEHYYLENDSDNQAAIVQANWIKQQNYTKRKTNTSINNRNNTLNKQHEYHLYQDTDGNNLFVEFNSLNATSVHILLTDIGGRIFYKKHSSTSPYEIYKESIDISSIPIGQYILHLSIDKEELNSKIIKK